MLVFNPQWQFDGQIVSDFGCAAFALSPSSRAPPLCCLGDVSAVAAYICPDGSLSGALRLQVWAEPAGGRGLCGQLRGCERDAAPAHHG